MTDRESDKISHIERARVERINSKVDQRSSLMSVREEGFESHRMAYLQEPD
jgi:hypothetical protein